MSRKILIEINADASQFIREMKRAQIAATRSWWRRTLLRIALWRLDRKAA